MRCPDCDGELTATRLAEVELDECSGCGGLWFVPGELSAWGAADSRPPEEASSGDCAVSSRAMEGFASSP